MEKKYAQAKWSELPTELLHLILKKLGCADIIRFKAVSTSWCLAANSYTSSTLYSPWLMFPTVGKEHSCFFNFAKKKFYELKRVFKGFNHTLRVVGSSHGWLIISLDRDKLCVLNPFSEAKIEFPKVNFRIGKTILSSDPSLNERFSAITKKYDEHRSPNGLALIHNMNDGNNSWTAFSAQTRYWDIICHNDRLYALLESETGLVEIWDIHHNPLPVIITAVRAPPPSPIMSFSFSSGNFSQDCFLVESLVRFCIWC